MSNITVTLACAERRARQPFKLTDISGRIKYGQMVWNHATARHEIEMSLPEFLAGSKSIALAGRLAGNCIFVSGIRDDDEGSMNEFYEPAIQDYSERLGVMTTELASKYVALIEKKLGKSIGHDGALPEVRLIQEFRDMKSVVGIGFEVVFPWLTARQAVLFKNHVGIQEAAITALAEYFQSPDERIVIDLPYPNDTCLIGRELRIVTCEGVTMIEPITPEPAHETKTESSPEPAPKSDELTASTPFLKLRKIGVYLGVFVPGMKGQALVDAINAAKAK